MDQLGQWVRFADTKATILVAALGVILTMLMTNGDTIAAATDLSNPQATITYGLLAVVTLSFVWTLLWLLGSISARSTSTSTGINRFAWPTLARTDGLTLLSHGQENDVREDAWQQVADLAGLAKKKFGAFNKALGGFAVVIVSGAALVAFAIAATTTSPTTQTPPPSDGGGSNVETRR